MQVLIMKRDLSEVPQQEMRLYTVNAVCGTSERWLLNETANNYENFDGNVCMKAALFCSKGK
jgi:hypothetical protein